MNIISLEQNNSSFISNAEQDKNFSALDYISISSYALRNSESNKCVSFLKFNLDLLSCSDIIINSAKLLLPLEILKFNSSLSPKEITLSTVLEDFSFKNLTWNNQPKSSSYKSLPITKKEFKNNCITVNVTSLVNQWLYHNIENYGIKLSVDPHNIMIILPKKNIKFSPKLVINYSYKNKDDFSASALFIRSKNIKSLVINPNDPIIMDDVFILSPNGLNYNTDTGIITIHKKGYYNFQFDLNIIGTGVLTDSQDQLLTVALKNLSTNEIISFNTPEVIPARMYGYGIILTKKENEEYTLINNSPQILQLADLPYQSSLSLSKIY